MDHSPMVYLIGPDGKYVTRFGHRVGPDRIAARMKRIFLEAEKSSTGSRAALVQ